MLHSSEHLLHDVGIVCLVLLSRTYNPARAKVGRHEKQCLLVMRRPGERGPE